MRIFILGIILLLGFSGCSSISLHVGPQTLHSGKCDIKTSLTQVAHQTHGGPLDLTREVYKDSDGNFIVYEKGQLDDSLIFIATLPDIMKAGFEMESYKSYSLDRHHDLITGISRNGKRVFILAQSLNEGFSIIYSQNYEPLRALVNCLDDISTPQFSSTFANSPKEAILSDWRSATFARHRIAVSKYFEEF